MKTLSTFCLLLICGVCFGQDYIRFDFSPENHLPFSSYNRRLWQDTISNPNNIWQVGRPKKLEIDSPLSSPNVLITDTANSYPVNDTSSFVLSFRACEFCQNVFEATAVYGYYKVASDSLKDYGYFELSTDSGKNWVNLMTDTSYKWDAPKPVLTGHSGTWKLFIAPLNGIALQHPPPFDVFFRITFVSDGIPDTLSGLAFDNLGFYSYYEGVSQVQNNALLSLYPNPVTDLLYIERKGALSKGQLQILDEMGKVVFEDHNFTAPSISTKALGLPAGLYFLHFTSGDTYAVQKFLVQS